MLVLEVSCKLWRWEIGNRPQRVFWCNTHLQNQVQVDSWENVKFQTSIFKMHLFSFIDSLFFSILFPLAPSCSLSCLWLVSHHLLVFILPCLLLWFWRTLSSNHCCKCQNCQCKNYKSRQACSYNHYHSVHFKKTYKSSMLNPQKKARSWGYLAFPR